MRARSILFLAALSLVMSPVRALAVLIVPEDLNPGNNEVSAIDRSIQLVLLRGRGPSQARWSRRQGRAS